jgi:hypothetical protein
MNEKNWWPRAALLLVNVGSMNGEGRYCRYIVAVPAAARLR